jgi:hypothetical protein
MLMMLYLKQQQDGDKRTYTRVPRPWQLRPSPPLFVSLQQHSNKYADFRYTINYIVLDDVNDDDESSIKMTPRRPYYCECDQEVVEVVVLKSSILESFVLAHNININIGIFCLCSYGGYWSSSSSSSVAGCTTTRQEVVVASPPHILLLLSSYCFCTCTFTTSVTTSYVSY